MGKLLVALILVLCVVAMASTVSARCYNDRRCPYSSQCSPRQYCKFTKARIGVCCDRTRCYNDRRCPYSSQCSLRQYCKFTKARIGVCCDRRLG